MDDKDIIDNSNDEPATSDAFIGGKKQTKPKRRHKRPIYALVVLLVLFVVVAAWFFVLKVNNNLSDDKQTNGCQYQAQSPIYNEAAEAIKSNQNDKLSAVVEKIKQQENYKKDPNCLYPIIYSNFQQAETDPAKANYKLLLNSYDDDKGLNGAYQPLGVSNIDDVSSWVKAQEKFYSESNAGVSIMGIPDAGKKK